jgi:exonuclease III
MTKTSLKIAVLFFLMVMPNSSYSFSLLSYNVAEMSEHSPERISNLVSNIFKLSPDIVLLQEVKNITKNELDRLVKNNGYRIYTHIAQKIPTGGLVTLVKVNLEVEDWHYHVMPSEMERGFLQLTLSGSQFQKLWRIQVISATG